jgi:hypothetical protein
MKEKNTSIHVKAREINSKNSKIQKELELSEYKSY